MRQLFAGILLVGLTVSAPMAQASQSDDPWEGFNRAIFAFNDTIDRYFLKPVAVGYTKAVPEVVRNGVSNFFGNISDVKTVANDLFQAKFKQAGLDSTRVLVNTTVGIAGFIDISSRIGLDEHDEDFGQTLGYWGVKPGPYLVLPLLGPSTVRDAGGLIPDYFISPNYQVGDNHKYYEIKVVQAVDTRAGLLKAERLVVGDRYTFFREAYLQRRNFLVHDGVIQDNFNEDDSLFQDDGTDSQ